MNRFVLVVAIAAVLGYVQGNMDDPKVKAVIEKCIAEEKLTPADIDALQQHSSDLTREAKCMIACSLKGFGLFSADGKSQKDVYLAQVEAMANGDAEKNKQGTEMYEICEKAVSASDVCETAFQWADCFKNEMTARNIPLEL